MYNYIGRAYVLLGQCSAPRTCVLRLLVRIRPQSMLPVSWKSTIFSLHLYYKWEPGYRQLLSEKFAVL